MYLYFLIIFMKSYGNYSSLSASLDDVIKFSNLFFSFQKLLKKYETLLYLQKNRWYHLFYWCKLLKNVAKFYSLNFIQIFQNRTSRTYLFFWLSIKIVIKKLWHLIRNIKLLSVIEKFMLWDCAVCVQVSANTFKLNF